MTNYARVLFELIDRDLDTYAKRIRNRVFSTYRTIAWTPEQYQQLQPLVREELDALVRSILGVLDNVGGRLPDGVVGYSIQAHPDEAEIDGASNTWHGAAIEQEGLDIGVNNADYANMWSDYLAAKRGDQPK